MGISVSTWEDGRLIQRLRMICYRRTDHIYISTEISLEFQTRDRGLSHHALVILARSITLVSTMPSMCVWRRRYLPPADEVSRSYCYLRTPGS